MARGPSSSPPCFGDDPEQARDVARWRTAERARLRAARMEMTQAERQEAGARLATHLEALLATMDLQTVSFYWPIKGEPDLRALMAALHGQGVTIALPLVERKQAPLVFRLWTPDTAMVRGDWNIPVPPPDAPVLTPQITLAPLVGWDDSGYRLGYGGGYFDRTLAALTPAPVTIGVGYANAWLATIFPQPHDIPLDFILTDTGPAVRRGTV